MSREEIDTFIDEKNSLQLYLKYNKLITKYSKETWLNDKNKDTLLKAKDYVDKYVFKEVKVITIEMFETFLKDKEELDKFLDSYNGNIITLLIMLLIISNKIKEDEKPNNTYTVLQPKAEDLEYKMVKLENGTEIRTSNLADVLKVSFDQVKNSDFEKEFNSVDHIDSGSSGNHYLYDSHYKLILYVMNKICKCDLDVYDIAQGIMDSDYFALFKDFMKDKTLSKELWIRLKSRFR